MKRGTKKKQAKSRRLRVELQPSVPAAIEIEDPWCDLPLEPVLVLDSPGHRPVRMCLGCRERQPQDCLLRLQLDAEGIVIVERSSQRLPGRSAYVCPRSGCLDAVLRRGDIVFKRSKYDKIIVRLDARQAERLRYAFKFAARRMRGSIGVGPRG